jgi:hypothetical protein
LLYFIGKHECYDLLGCCKERLELTTGVEITPSLKSKGTEMICFHPWWNRKLESLLHRAFGEIIHRVTVLDRTENASWLFRVPELSFLEEHCAPSRRSREGL